MLLEKLKKILPHDGNDYPEAFKMINGSKNISYNNLVEMYFKKKISKKYQQSNWQKRPLSLSQLNYADRKIKTDSSKRRK